MPLNIYDFADRVNANDRLCADFIEDFVATWIDSLDKEDMYTELYNLLYAKYREEVNEHGADDLIHRVGDLAPEVLERFDVDPTLIA